MIKKLDDPVLAKRRAHIFAHPDLLDEIVAHVANGGTVQTLVDTWEIFYSDVTHWLHQDEQRERAYMKALNDRAEWGKERFLAEIRTIGLVNIREAFREDGTLKPIADIPDHILRCVEGIEVDELFDGVGQERAQVGVTKKIKMASKLKALELALKQAGLLTDVVKVDLSTRLENILAASNKTPPPAV